MKKLSDTLKELGIDFRFPIIIKDARGNETYTEYSNRYYYRSEYDARGNETYFEDSDGYWNKCEYDARGNETYYENSDGVKRGTPRSQSCDGKVIEVDGKKYKLKEL